MQRVEYRKINSKKIAELKAKWFLDHKDLVAKKQKEYKSKNKEAVARRQAAYVAKNARKIKENKAAYKKANREIFIRSGHKRRAIKRAVGGTLSRGLTNKLLKLQKGKCPCCNQPLGSDYHLDHIMPLALGGSNTNENIQLLRSVCNMRKHTKHPVDFMQSRGFLL